MAGGERASPDMQAHAKQVRQRAKKVLKKVRLDGIARAALHAYQRRLSRLKRTVWELTRKSGRTDRRIFETYLGDHPVRKLHIGCGDNVLDGWLNVDLYPLSQHIVHLDATTPFPIGDEAFEYIFSEHMIEHISYPQGQAMLSECHRILKNEGKIRVSTPDLAFLIGLYQDEKSDLQKRYIEWVADRIARVAPCDADTFVINHYVRAWGHQFIYDEKTLRQSLEKAGFSNVRSWKLNESEDEVFRDLENENRMPPGFLRLETMTVEGTKLPAA